MSAGNFGPGYPAVVAPTVAPTTFAGSGGAVSANVDTVLGEAAIEITVTGSTGTGPSISVSVNNNIATYAYTSADTSTTQAALHLAVAINASGAIAGSVTAHALGNVVTLIGNDGAAPSTVAVSATASGGAAVAISGATLQLGSPLVIPLRTQTLTIPGAGGPVTLYAGVPISVDPITKAFLRKNGLIA